MEFREEAKGASLNMKNAKYGAGSTVVTRY